MKAFESELIARVHLVRVPWHLDRAACDEFIHTADSWKELDVVLHVFDFSEVRSVNQTFYRAVTEFKSALSGKAAHLVSIHLSAELLKQLQQDGMEQLFSPQNSMKQAIQSLGLAAQPASFKLDDDLLKPLHEGLKQALTSMYPGEKKFQTGKLLPPLSIKDPDQLAVTLGATTQISGAHAQGQIGMYFTREALKTLFEQVSHQTFESEQTSRAQDLVRELLNMATGRAKADWHANRGLTLERSIPQTVVGDSLQEHLHGFVAEAAILPIDTMKGQVFLGIKLASPSPTK